MSWPDSVSGVVIALLAGVLVLVASDILSARLEIRRRLRANNELLDTEGASPVVELANPEVRSDNDSYIVKRLNALFPLSGGMRTGMILIGTALFLWILIAPAMIFFGVPPAFAALLALAAAANFGWNVGSILESRKRDAFCDRLVTTVEDFQRLVRFGTSSLRALRSVAQTAEAPLGPSLRSIVRETDFGVPVEQAMAWEAHRIRMGELAMLAAIISTQSGTGGSLSEAVGNLADMLRERLESKSRLKAATAESKITLIVLAAVPFLAVSIQAFTQPDLVDTLLGDARHLFGIGVALIGAGLYVSWMIIRGAQR